MRIKRVIKSLSWDLIYYLIVVLLGFLAPRYIILVYGSEVNGLSSTITQILNVMLLLQAGATTAAVYSLYRPLHNRDYLAVGEWLSASEKYFHKIAVIFLFLMLTGAVLTSVFIDSDLNKYSIFIAFVIMGLKSFLDLWYTSKFRIIFTSDQKRYLVSIATLIEQILYYCLVFLTIYFRLCFVWMYAWFLLGCVVKIVFLKWKYNLNYGDRIPRVNPEKHGIVPGQFYSLANEVSHDVVSISITVIMSFMYGLKEVSVYSIYSMVNQALFLISSSLYNSFSPSFGNLVASDNAQQINRVFKFFQYVFILFNTLLSICTLYLILPFVRLYTAGVTDTNYINVLLAVLLVVSGLISAYRIPYNILVSSFGLFKETWKQPVITAVVTIAISCGLGLINFSLILVGPILFYAVNFIYQYFIIKKILPNLDYSDTYKWVLVSAVGIGLAYSAMLLFPISNLSVLSWISAAVVMFVASTIYLFGATCLFGRQYIQQIKTYSQQLLRINS